MITSQGGIGALTMTPERHKMLHTVSPGRKLPGPKQLQQ